MFLINLCSSLYGPALPFSRLSWEDMSIGEIIFKSVPELWEGMISKAPEIVINHLNETLIGSCVHYSTQEGSRPTQISSWWYFKWQWYHSSCRLSKKWFSCTGKKKICCLPLEIQFSILAWRKLLPHPAPLSSFQSSDLTRSTITPTYSQNSAIPAPLEGNDPGVPSKGVVVLTESRRNEAYPCPFSREGFSRHPDSTFSEEPSHTIFWWLPQFREARTSPPLSLRADSPKSTSHLLHWQRTPFWAPRKWCFSRGRSSGKEKIHNRSCTEAWRQSLETEKGLRRRDEGRDVCLETISRSPNQTSCSFKSTFHLCPISLLILTSSKSSLPQPNVSLLSESWEFFLIL